MTKMIEMMVKNSSIFKEDVLVHSHYMYVYVYVYMYIHIYILRMYMCIYIYVYIYVCMYIVNLRPLRLDSKLPAKTLLCCFVPQPPWLLSLPPLWE